MAYKTDSERKKSKPRGRPFTKGNKRGRIESSLLVNEGSAGIDSGPSLVNIPDDIKPNLDHSSSVKEQDSVRSDKVDSSSYIVEDEIKFQKGENSLSIRLIKTNSRQFHMQVLLNDAVEIKPAKYSGPGIAYGFWNLLKQGVK